MQTQFMQRVPIEQLSTDKSTGATTPQTTTTSATGSLNPSCTNLLSAGTSKPTEAVTASVFTHQNHTMQSPRSTTVLAQEAASRLQPLGKPLSSSKPRGMRVADVSLSRSAHNLRNLGSGSSGSIKRLTGKDLLAATSSVYKRRGSASGMTTAASMSALSPHSSTAFATSRPHAKRNRTFDRGIDSMGGTSDNSKTPYERATRLRRMLKMNPPSSAAGAVGASNLSSRPGTGTAANTPFALRRGNRNGSADRMKTLTERRAMQNSSVLGSSSSFSGFAQMSRSHASAPVLNHKFPHSSSGNSVGSSGSTSTSGTGCSMNQPFGLRGHSAMQIAQRSNSGQVKTVIQQLTKQTAFARSYSSGSVDGNETDDTSDSLMNDDQLPTPPLQQMSMLSQWASVDAYYRVIIGKYQGIPAIIHAMRQFASIMDIQAFGCSALSNLNDKQQIAQFGGVSTILDAIEHHPTSIAVQSSGLEALMNQKAFLKQESYDILLGRLQPLLQNQIKDIYLTATGKQAATYLTQVLAICQQEQQGQMAQQQQQQQQNLQKPAGAGMDMDMDMSS